MVFRSPSDLTIFVLALTLLGSGAIAFAQSPASKTSPDIALQRGQEALKKGDLNQARAELEQAVRLAPKDAAAQSELGWVLALEGQTDAAIEHLRAAIQLKPSFVNARVTLASVLSQQGKTEQAEQELRAALKIAPDNAEAHRMLAKVLSASPGDEALTEMQRAVDLAPKRADIRDELGTILAQRNRDQEATAAFKQALTLNPDLELAHFHLGVEYLHAHNLEEAAG